MKVLISLALAALMSAPLSAFQGNGDAATTLNLGAPSKDGNCDFKVDLKGFDAKSIASFTVTVPILKTDTADAKALKINAHIQAKINTTEGGNNASSGCVANVIVVSSNSTKVKVIRIVDMEDGTGQEMKVTEKPDSGKSPAPAPASGPPPASNPQGRGIKFHLSQDPSGVPSRGQDVIVRVGVNGEIFETVAQVGQTRLQVYQILGSKMFLAGKRVFAGHDGLYVFGDIDEMDTLCLDEVANIGWKRF